MRVDEITVEVRDKNLVRVSQVLPQFWSDVKLVVKHLGVGSWELSLPAENEAAEALAVPGAGIVVTGPDGVLLSGPMTSAVRTVQGDDPLGTIKFTGVTDDILFAHYTLWPSPSKAVDDQDAAYDNRSGVAETVVRGFVDENFGPSARSERTAGLLAGHLTLEPDGSRGDTLKTVAARFPVAGEFLSSLARLAGLGYRIIQSGTDLKLVFFEPADKTKLIRLDVANGTLEKAESSVAAPDRTRMIVAGQGEGKDRTIKSVSSAGSTAAESEWGFRIEEFKDRRDTDDTDELVQSGHEDLEDGGSTQRSVKIQPAGDTMRYGTDWFLGDKISAVVGGETVERTVTAVGISLSTEGVLIAADVGDD